MHPLDLLEDGLELAALWLVIRGVHQEEFGKPGDDLHGLVHLVAHGARHFQDALEFFPVLPFFLRLSPVRQVTAYEGESERHSIPVSQDVTIQLKGDLLPAFHDQ